MTNWPEDFELESRRMSPEHREAEADYRRAEAMERDTQQADEDDPDIETIMDTYGTSSMCSDPEQGRLVANPDEVSKDAGDDPF
jgi:hypothetical protein